MRRCSSTCRLCWKNRDQLRSVWEVRLRKQPVNLKYMAKRGLLFRLRKGETVKYGAVPFIVGMYEFQVKRLDSELEDLMEQYFDQRLNQSIAGVDGLLLRTVPVEKSIVPEHHVAAFDDAVAIIKNKDIIAVGECICRKGRKIVGKGCDKPIEACFSFGSIARFYIENNMGRQVDVEEAVDILRKAQDSGACNSDQYGAEPWRDVQLLWQLLWCSLSGRKNFLNRQRSFFLITNPQ